MTTKKQAIRDEAERLFPPTKDHGSNPAVIQSNYINQIQRVAFKDGGDFALSLPAPSSATVNGELIRDLKAILEREKPWPEFESTIRQAIHALSNGSDGITKDSDENPSITDQIKYWMDELIGQVKNDGTGKLSVSYHTYNKVGRELKKLLTPATPPPVANDAGRKTELDFYKRKFNEKAKEALELNNRLGQMPIPSDAMVTEEDKGRRSFAEWCSSEGYTFWNLYKMWTHKLKPQLYLETEFLYQKWMQSLTDLNPKSK